MTQSLTLPVAGLVTDPGPFSAAPEGSLIQAQNVAFRRAGVIEPRAKFVVNGDPDFYASPVEPKWVGSHFDGTSTSEYMAAIQSGTVHTLRRDASTTLTTTVPGLQFSEFTTNNESQQGRLFLTTEAGVVSVDSNQATNYRLAGMPQAGAPLIQTGTVSGGLNKWLQNDYATAYRVCFAREVNTTLLVGAPSASVIQRNNSGSDVYTTVRVYLTNEIEAGDLVQIYRAYVVTPYTSTPADEYRLRTTSVVTSSDVSNGYVDFTDAIFDTQWSGPSLYTNAGQEGALMANYRPGTARDVKLYNGMMFYAGHRSTQQVTATVKAIGAPAWGASTGFDFSQSLCSIKIVMAPGGTTSGSTVINGPAFTIQETGALAVGQVITKTPGGLPGNADTYFSANTRITAIGANTVTIDKPTLAAIPASEVLTFWDWVNVNDGTDDYTLYANAHTTSGGSGNAMTAYLPTTFPTVFGTDDQQYSTTSMFAGGAPDLERAWYQNYADSDIHLHTFESGQGAYKGVTLRFQADVGSESTFTVTSTKPNAFDAYLDATTGVTSSLEGFPGRLAWSKLDQPDAVPLPYFQDIGDRNQPIYRVMPTQDALWVFKGDGIFRLYGRTPDNLTIDPVDPTARMTESAPQWVTKYGDSVFAWTTRGVIETGGFGVRLVDAMIHQTLTNDTSNSLAVQGAYATASSYNKFVLFGFRINAYEETVNAAYVYWPELGVWSKWTIPFSIQTANVGFQNSPIFACGVGTVSYIDEEHDIRSALLAPSYDDTGWRYFVEAGTSGTTLNFSEIDTPAFQYSPAVGDAWVIGGSVYYVTGVIDANTVTVDRDASATIGMTIEPKSAFTTIVQWIARDENNPAAVKHWQDVTIGLDRLRGGTRYLTVFDGYQNSDIGLSGYIGVTYETSLASAEFSTFRPWTKRTSVPTSCSRDWAIKVGLYFMQAGQWFTTSSLGVQYEYTGSRVGKAV